MTEPTTETGRAVAARKRHMRQSVNGCVLCEVPWSQHLTATTEDILAIEREARNQGAAAERARLREGLEKLPVHYRRNGFANSTAWVTRRDVLRLLAEPQSDE